MQYSPYILILDPKVHYEHNRSLYNSLLIGDILISQSLTSTIKSEKPKFYAFLYLGNGMVLESLGDEIEINHIGKYLNRHYLVSIYRCMSLSPEHIKTIIKQIKKKIGYKESYIHKILYYLGLYKYEPLWIGMGVNGQTTGELFIEEIARYIEVPLQGSLDLINDQIFLQSPIFARVY